MATKIIKGRDVGWEVRKAMIQEYLTGQDTKAAIWRKYTGQKKDHGQLLSWIRKLGYQDRGQQEASATSPNEEKIRMLERHIQLLKRSLEISQLKAEGADLMIEAAESLFKLPIRKKLLAK